MALEEQQAATSAPRTYTVRELITALAASPDMDAVVNVSLYNSDPVPVAEIDTDESNEVTLTGKV